MGTAEEINGKNAHHPEDDDLVWVVRLVPENELKKSGRATPTGIHLALLASEVSGLGAWELGRLWGYSEARLGEMIQAGEHLVAVVAPASPNVGRATAQSLAGLLLGLRPDEAVHGSAEDLMEAARIPVEEAQRVGLRDAQRALSRVFGLEDDAFGTGVIPEAGDPDDDDEDADAQPAFVIDEKIDPEADNPLEAGSSLLLEDYPAIPAVIRLPWDGEDEE